MPELFLGLSLVGAALTVNAHRPSRWAWAAIPSFLAGWLVSEFPVHHLALQAALATVMAAGGGLEAPAGWVAVALTAGSWVGLVLLVVSAQRAAGVVDRALAEALGPGARVRERLPWGRLLLPLRSLDRRSERIRNLPFADGGRRGRPLRLDIYRPRRGAPGRPVILYIHGGGWVLGDKRDQGVPMLRHLAARGWVGVTANYRLSPAATFPDHLLDVKKALAWIRAHIAAYGGDPAFLAVSGGSAGGHLAALAALTAGDAEHQPGFEGADTSVQACVAFYGVYDLANRDGVYHAGMARLLARHVMKATPAEAPEAYEKGSPLDRIHAGAPPWFVIHGANDTLVPVAEARSFVRRLRELSRAPVAYAELPGAQHAFEVLPSVRTVHVVRGVERFLDTVRERARVGAPERGGGPPWPTPSSSSTPSARGRGSPPGG